MTKALTETPSTHDAMGMNQEGDHSLIEQEIERRKELADFLRTRRERIRPPAAFYSPSSRRRTPGLRREEVAELASVGATWYTWLEQARDIHPSNEVLMRLAQALQLDPFERRHMFDLAGRAAPDAFNQTKEIVPPTCNGFLTYAYPKSRLLSWANVGMFCRGTLPQLNSFLISRSFLRKIETGCMFSFVALNSAAALLIGINISLALSVSSEQAWPAS